MEHFFTEEIPDLQSDPSQAKRGGVKSFLVELLQTLVLSAALYLAINAISTRIRVESVSMQPTLYAADMVLVNKLAYRLGSINRGDIIVFRNPIQKDGEPYIKRVIGLPGDMLEINNGKVFINGTLLAEPYIASPPGYSGTWNVPQDSLFVLGDNRNSSSDSHQWGVVVISDVIGRAEFIYWPFSHWQNLHLKTATAASP